MARMQPAALPASPSNRLADQEAAARLGQRLFFDPGLSPHGVSCASCHDPAKGFADGRALAQGVGTTSRNTPSVVGSQAGPFYFWDGRADSLWSQALGPMESPVEMGSDRVFVVRRVASAFGEEFSAVTGLDLGFVLDLPSHGRPEAAAGPAAEGWSALTEAQQQEVNRAFAEVGKVIEAYERRVVPGPTSVDRYIAAVLQGDEAGGGHLDPTSLDGLRLYLGRGQCVQCHGGPWLTDRAFHNLGLPEPTQGYDPGRTVGAVKVLASPFNCRGPFSDTQDCPELLYLNPSFDDFQNAFKTPSLRGVASTAPYMHTGAFPDLRSVLAFYSELPGQPLGGHRELTLQPLKLSEAEQEALLALLQRFSEGEVPATWLRPEGLSGLGGSPPIPKG